jgi:hypothetical protein
MGNYHCANEADARRKPGSEKSGDSRKDRSGSSGTYFAQ